MKLLTFILSLTIVGCAVKPVSQTVTPVPDPMTNILDSASYSMGLSFANFYKQQGVTNINSALCTQAINDVFSGKPTLLDENTANTVMNAYMTQLQQQKSRAAIDSGVAFLERNKLRPEVKTTASGLQYEVLKEGSGIKPVASDSVTCHYKGSLLNGFVFDESYDDGIPITFHLSGVIKGWTEGVQLMTVGSKYRFYVPYTLAYGAFDYGPIPGGSMLTFEVELLNVKK